MKKNNKKKTLTVILLVGLVLLIPVALGYLFLHENMDTDLNRGKVHSILLRHGEETEEITDAEEIAFFVKAATEGSTIQESANDLSDYRKLEVTFHKYNQKFEYAFYLSDSENNCVYTDPEGKLFLFSPETAKELQSHRLLENYALSFAEYPSVTLRHGAKEYGALEIEGSWDYTRADGEKAKQKISEKTKNTAVLPQGGKIELAFSIQPDYCSVLLSKKDVKDGELLYSGVYEEMPLIHMEKDTLLTMTVSCDWYEKEGGAYHGSIAYTFDVFYDIPTLCSLDRKEVRPGETLLLTVTHSSSEQLAVNPTFASENVEVKREGELWIATIPVSANATAGSFSVMVMGSDVEENLEVTVLPSA